MALKRYAYTRPLAACAVGRALSLGISVPCAGYGRHEALTSRRVAAVCAEGLGVGPSGAVVGADLGGSSKYSSEALED